MQRLRIRGVHVLDVKYSKEDFGYLVVFPDGSIDLFQDSVSSLFGKARSKSEFDAHRLSRLRIGPDFHLRRPLIVWFEVTKACDLRCSHCYIDAGRRRPAELSTAEVFYVLDDLAELGAFSLVLAGGEPYLRRDFPEILEHAAELGFVIAVVTNGSLLTRDLLRRIPKERCRVTLSVDGMDAHNRIRGGRSTFALMKERLAMLREEGVPHSVSSVISKANIGELEGLLAWCESEDIIFRTVTFNPLGRGLRNLGEHALSKEDAEASSAVFMMQKRFEREKDKHTGICVSKFFDYALNLMYMTRREHCSRSIAYLAANGDVYPCVSSAATDTFKAGNVRETPFSQLWETSFRDMRAITWQNFVEETCHECPFNGPDYFCANRCPVMSLVLNGTLLGCGATEFEKADLQLRTERLRTEMGYVY
jgi:radical SAM protein with 4Fe4S-binding SPASM domain